MHQPSRAVGIEKKSSRGLHVLSLMSSRQVFGTTATDKNTIPHNPIVDFPKVGQMLQTNIAEESMNLRKIVRALSQSTNIAEHSMNLRKIFRPLSQSFMGRIHVFVHGSVSKNKPRLELAPLTLKSEHSLTSSQWTKRSDQSQKVATVQSALPTCSSRDLLSSQSKYHVFLRSLVTRKSPPTHRYVYRFTPLKSHGDSSLPPLTKASVTRRTPLKSHGDSSLPPLRKASVTRRTPLKSHGDSSLPPLAQLRVPRLAPDLRPGFDLEQLRPRMRRSLQEPSHLLLSYRREMNHWRNTKVKVKHLKHHRARHGRQRKVKVDGTATQRAPSEQAKIQGRYVVKVRKQSKRPKFRHVFIG